MVAGVQITGKEYLRTIVRGIPNELATFASHVVSSALINATAINIDAPINQIYEEADRLKIRRAGNPAREGRTSQRQKTPLWPQKPMEGGDADAGASATREAKRAIGHTSVAPQRGRGM